MDEEELVHEYWKSDELTRKIASIFNVPMTIEKFKCLRPGQLLNDEVGEM